VYVSFTGWSETFTLSFWEYTVTSPINEKFMYAGYKTRNFVENLGYFHVSFNYMIFASIAIPVAACCFISVKKFTTDSRFMLAMWIRYAFLTSLILTVGVLVSFLKPSLTQANAPNINELPDAKFSDALANVTAMIAGFFLTLMLFVLLFLCFESRKYARAMAEERNANYAAELLFALTSTRFEII
jgi:hypothetical protein